MGEISRRYKGDMGERLSGCSSIAHLGLGLGSGLGLRHRSRSRSSSAHSARSLGLPPPSALLPQLPALPKLPTLLPKLPTLPRIEARRRSAAETSIRVRVAALEAVAQARPRVKRLAEQSHL